MISRRDKHILNYSFLIKYNILTRDNNISLDLTSYFFNFFLVRALNPGYSKFKKIYVHIL